MGFYHYFQVSKTALRKCWKCRIYIFTVEMLLIGSCCILTCFLTAAGQTRYEGVSPAKARTLRSTRRSHPQLHPPQQQKQQTQSMPPLMPQQSSVLFQQPSPASQQQQQQHQQQVVICASPQYQTFSISDLGSSTSPSHSPPAQPQLPSYSHSLGVQNYKQVYPRTSPQQQAGFPSFCLPTSSVTVSQSPTPCSEPSNLRQSVAAAPTLKTSSLRSNSLPGLQDDTFVMPKVSTLIYLVWVACLFDICVVAYAVSHGCAFVKYADVFMDSWDASLTISCC